MEIIVNGAARTVAPHTTIASLVADLGLEPGRVAVEKNREVIPRAQHASTELHDGDRLELVSFVGGG
jgi:thiamine biosynthesis protein ThiS